MMKGPEGAFLDGHLKSIQIRGKIGFKDTRTNTTRIPAIFDDYTILSGYAIAAKISNKWAIIDENGGKATEFIYDQIELGGKHEWEGLRTACIANIKGGWGILSDRGIPITSFDFEYIKTITYSKNPAYYVLYKDEKLYIYNNIGERLSPETFDSIYGTIERSNYRKPYLIVEKNNMKGLLSADNRTTYRCVFDEIKRVGKCLAFKQHNRWAFISD